MKIDRNTFPYKIALNRYVMCTGYSLIAQNESGVPIYVKEI